MTQLAKTLDLFCEHYPAAFPHSEGMDRIGFAFRSRASNLRRWYGIKANTLITKEDKIAHGIDPDQKQAWYVLLESPEEARAKYAISRVPTPGKADTPKTTPRPKGTVPFKPTGEISAYLGQLGRKSGEKRRENPKYVLCPDGKYRPRSKSKIEAKEKQSTLPLEAG